jgi:collagen type VI alpha
LNFAQQHLFSRIPSGKQNVLLLITDGVSYDDVTRPALELKRRGVEIFVVGVGRNIVRNELESIGSTPADEHVVMTSYDFSDAMLEDIKHRICLSAQRKGTFVTRHS